MRFKLHPKLGELDIPTIAELEQLRTNERKVAEADAVLNAPRYVRKDKTVATDGTGNATFARIYTIPAGMELRLHRVIVTATGYDAGTPFATGAFEVLRDGLIVESFQAVGFPSVIGLGSADAMHFRNGETVDVLVLKGPATTNVNVALRGWLHRLTPKA